VDAVKSGHLWREERSWQRNDDEQVECIEDTLVTCSEGFRRNLYGLGNCYGKRLRIAEKRA
jgi:hypothetical protein